MTKETPAPHERVMFAVAPDENNNPFVLLGIPQAAWEYMKDGKTHTFDFSSIGLNLKIVAFGAKDHDEIRGIIKEYSDADGIPIKEDLEKDFSIKTPPEH